MPTPTIDLRDRTAVSTAQIWHRAGTQAPGSLTHPRTEVRAMCDKRHMSARPRAKPNGTQSSTQVFIPVPAERARLFPTNAGNEEQEASRFRHDRQFLQLATDLRRPAHLACRSGLWELHDNAANLSASPRNQRPQHTRPSSTVCSSLTRAIKSAVATSVRQRTGQPTASHSVRREADLLAHPHSAGLAFGRPAYSLDLLVSRARTNIPHAGRRAHP